MLNFTTGVDRLNMIDLSETRITLTNIGIGTM